MSNLINTQGNNYNQVTVLTPLIEIASAGLYVNGTFFFLIEPE